MNYGPATIQRQFNKGIDYIQNSYNISDGVTKAAPTLIFKGVVIDVDFDIVKSTTYASLVPPFSVFAKIIGMDNNVLDPTNQSTKIYYPPLFPMHTICIPEIGEEVLILKENSEFTSQGYYIGRINDSSPLNISYARDYIGINDSETDNSYRYGFSFDVRELRSRQAHRMPSAADNNISIPMTFGDVVQQGRSKTYVRHSFNRNNKKGVLEQGIRLDGQLSSRGIVNSFDYDTETQRSMGENGELLQENNRARSIDPSIGQTKTKTIHLVDSSIKRLGNYNYQSYYGNEQSDELLGEDKAMIVNIADEIYNISSREVAGLLYRQVLGEKLVTQQQQSYNLIKEMMNTVSEFASTTQVLLDAFLEHTHALPKIELNLEKEIKFKDSFRLQPKVVRQPDQRVRIPGKVTRVKTGVRTIMKPGLKPGDIDYANPSSYLREIPIYKVQREPSRTIRVPAPPKIVPGRLITRQQRQTLNFEAIIGGEDNPRFTAPIETDKAVVSNNDELPVDFKPGDYSNESPVVPSAQPNPEKTELGLKTGTVDTKLQDVIDKMEDQQDRLSDLTLRVNQFLSKNQFIN